MGCNDTQYTGKYWCPDKLDYCYPDRKGLALGPIPSYLSLVSCSLSVLGSLLIVFSYLRWKDLRTGSRSIITFLSIADFFTAAGFIVAGGNYLKFYGQLEDSLDCLTFQQICKMQSFITTWSCMASFMWTSILAIYLYLTVVRQRTDWAARLVSAGHVIAWVLPFAIVYPLLCTERLGFSMVASSNWCYVSGTGEGQQPDHFKTGIPADITVLVLVAGKLWEVIAYGIVLVFYALIKHHIRKETESGSFLSDNLKQAALQIDRKLTFIPMVFILLRMWGTIQFLYVLCVSPWIECGCMPDGVWKGFFALGLLQAIGDGGQGWGNAILYVFASKTVRERLFGCLYRCCCCCWFCECLKRLPTAKPTISYQQRIAKSRRRRDQSTGSSQPSSRGEAAPTRGMVGSLVASWLQRQQPVNSVTFDNVSGGRIVFGSPGKTRYTPPRRVFDPRGKQRSTYVEYGSINASSPRGR